MWVASRLSLTTASANGGSAERRRLFARHRGAKESDAGVQWSSRTLSCGTAHGKEVGRMDDENMMFDLDAYSVELSEYMRDTQETSCLWEAMGGHAT
jgi:hypothetical protein